MSAFDLRELNPSVRQIQLSSSETPNSLSEVKILIQVNLVIHESDIKFHNSFDTQKLNVLFYSKLYPKIDT